jgi:hypothetical protein
VTDALRSVYCVLLWCVPSVSVAIDPVDGSVFVSSNIQNVIYRIDEKARTCTPVIGSANSKVALADGIGIAAGLRGPLGLSFTPDGSALWVADQNSHRVLRCTRTAISAGASASSSTATPVRPLSPALRASACLSVASLRPPPAPCSLPLGRHRHSHGVRGHARTRYVAFVL